MSDDAPAAAFEETKTSETVRQSFENRFHAWLQSAAAKAAIATGRDMQIHHVDLSLRTVDGTGIVERSLIWDGLATVDGDRLVVTEPFASGFEPDRPVHLMITSHLRKQNVIIVNGFIR